jgi:TolB protein
MRPGSWLQTASLIACTLAVHSPARGAEPVRLTHDGKLKAGPVVTPDGESIVYAELEKPELFRLKRLRLRDGKVEPLLKNPTKSEMDPALSADGKLYAFVRAQSAGTLSLVIRNVATGAEAEIMPESASGMRSPAFTPDGTRVLFAFADNARQDLFSVNRQGRDRRTVLSGPGVIHNWPCFSPDGKRLAFGSTRDGNYEIYVADADGHHVRRLTNSPFQDVRPRFSPNGRRIAFTSHRDGNAEVYVINADGTGLRRLTAHPDRDDFPAWHPDGRRLVFVSDRTGGHELYLVEVGP